MSCSTSSLASPHAIAAAARHRAAGGARRPAAAGADVPRPGVARAERCPAQSADCPAVPSKRSSKHHDRSRIPRACRPGLQPHPARPRDVRRPRHAAVALREARQRAVHVPARVGRRRRALRPLFVHRPAGEDPHPRARHRDRGRRQRRHRRAARGRSAGLRRRVPAPLPRGAAARAAALLRRARRLVRLRHGAPHRDEARRPRAAAGSGLADVPDILLLLTEELAVVDNLAGKISLIVYADPGEPDAYATARERLQALRRKLREPVSIPFQTATDAHAGAERVRRRRLPARGAAREGIHRRGRRDAGGAVAADAPPVRVVAAVALPRAALAQSVAVHVLLRLRRFPRRRRVARDPGAQGRHDGDAAADRRHAAARRDARGRRSSSPPSSWPIRRKSPST